ncbi:Vacuolar protein sorting-associated protein 29 [Coemansia biformis]|uniref:Vacuolar protein sorting-associated protein 29 n=1 Tax=Coemansia biformis TaxID=1286918 RepID=A0A9W8CNT7_9FUNG|nr:Vacuolar protein sorting-associated protein 29 [Coemansia biformis]
MLCTGNLTDRATLEYLQSITPDVRVVRGEFDDKAQNFPVSLRVVEQCDDDGGGGLAVGISNGCCMVPANGDVDTLAATARQMDVDVLVTGKTHRFEAYEEQGRFFTNPRKITGAFSPLVLDPIPSFVLLEIKPGTEIVAYVYQLENDEVVIHRTEYKKGEC